MGDWISVKDLSDLDFKKPLPNQKKNTFVFTFFCWKSRCYTFSWIKYCYDAIINYLHNELVVRWWMEINPLLCAYFLWDLFWINTYWHCCPNRCITWQGWNMIRPRAFIIVVLFDFMQILLLFFFSSSNQGIEIWEQFK